MSSRRTSRRDSRHAPKNAANSGANRPEPAPTVGGSFARPALAIFAVALVLRLIHLWQLRRAPFFDLPIGDGRAYDLWGQSIAAGDWIGQGVFYQAPLYAYFLGAIYTVAGHDLGIVRLVQAVIGSASCALVGAAGWRLFSRPAGIAAGLLLAIYAPAIFFDGLIQKSLLDLLFLSVMLWLLARWLVDHPERGAPWLWLGLTLGALSLTRENALVFVVVLLAWALKRDRHLSGARLRPAALLLAGLAIVLLPVALRNLAVGGEFHVTTSQFGPNFYIGNNAQATGGYDPLRAGRGSAQYEREDATALAEQAESRRLSPAEVSRYWTRQALDFITSQPGAWLSLMARKAMLVWNATEVMDTESQEAHAEWSSVLAILGSAGHFGVLVPLALFGAMTTWPERRRTGILIALVLTYAASVVLFYVFARYRFPIVPFLALFAGAGIAGAPRFVREAPRPVLAATLGVVAVAALLVNQPIVASDLTRAVTAANLGEALSAAGRHEEAVAEYRRAIALRPDWPVAHYNLGSALNQRGRPVEAIAEFERALALEPDYARARFGLGSALISAGRPRDAIGPLSQAAAEMPDSAEVRRALGIALARENRLREAVAAFSEAVQLAPDSADAHNDLGVALASQGDLAGAAERFARALALRPDFAEARRNLEAARHLAAAPAGSK